MTAPEEMLQELCRDLRQLWTQAGGPSLRVLSTRVGLGKTQINAILNGGVRRPPDWDVIKNLIDSVLRYANDHDRQGELSLRTGITEYWRPRYAMLEHAFRQVPRRSSSAEDRTTGPIPRQLPAPVAHFVGRSAELAALSRLLDENSDNPSTVLISAIGGTAGVGKTTLAVHWAYQVRDRFPDGQLYVNLRGFDLTDSVLEPSAVMRRFLEALGVPSHRLPPDADALAALYRSELAERRVLIVLDNARDSRQVQPLLPGATSCLVLVTSRSELSGLISTHGAHPVALDLLTHTEARQLLEHRLGRDRLHAELEAVDDIIRKCAQLPLALSIVAARAANQPQLPIRALAAELSDSGNLLNALTTDDPAADARAVFSWSYRALTPEAARLFRLLGLHPGPDFALPVAASLAALDPPRARNLLAQLTHASLLMQHLPGRYAFHDLLRAYAAEQTQNTDTDDQRRAANERMLDHYLHASRAAFLLLATPSSARALPPAQPGVALLTFANHMQALDWFATERVALLDALSCAFVAGHYTFVCHTAACLGLYLNRQGLWSEEVPIQRAAIIAAQRLGDAEAEAAAHVSLAIAYASLSCMDEADAHFRHALRLVLQLGALGFEALIECNLGALCEQRGRGVEAVEHAQRAAYLYEKIGDERWLGRALSGLANAQSRFEGQSVAYATCQRALTIQLKLDDRVGLAVTWHYMGRIQHRIGEHQKALESHQRALPLAREFAPVHVATQVLTGMGDAHHAMGNDSLARDTWQEALIILDQLQHTDAAQVRTKLATLSLQRNGARAGASTGES